MDSLINWAEQRNPSYRPTQLCPADFWQSCKSNPMGKNVLFNKWCCSSWTSIGRINKAPNKISYLLQKLTQSVHAYSLSCVQLFMTPWTVAHQVPLSMGFSRQEYWSGLPCPLPGDLPNPGIKPRSPTLQADSLPPEPPGKQLKVCHDLNVKLQNLYEKNIESI